MYKRQVVSQESIGAGIYSMWIQTDRIAADAKPGQFVSLYTNDKSKILPRPISLCEIDKENGRLHLVYRVTGQGTGTDEFSQMKAGDTIPVLGPLGNGFPVEKAEGKKAVSYTHLDVYKRQVQRSNEILLMVAK